MPSVNPLDKPTEPVASAYQLAVQNRDRLQTERVAEVRAHALHLSILDRGIQQHEREIALAESGASLDDYLVASQLIEVKWLNPERNRHDHLLMDEVLDDAIEAVRHGGNRLRAMYLGIKSFEGWTGQRNDSQYGHGPRHGSIWFSVGANRGVIRAREADSQLFTDEEIFSIIAFLRNLRDDHARITL